MNENDTKKIVYEKCIICNKETNIPINRHIDLRENYVEGAGQLCPECNKEIDVFYKK